MPLAWRGRPESARTEERIAWLNQVNEKRLRMLLERETREKPSNEIAGLEALLIEVLHCVKQPPVSRSVLLSAHSVEWVETSARPKINSGDFGLVRMCLDPELPYEVEFFAEIKSVESETTGWRVLADLALRSEHVVDLYQQLVFIYYRRARREHKLEPTQES